MAGYIKTTSFVRKSSGRLSFTVAALAISLCAAEVANAQEAIEEVVTTGTRVKGRTATETMAAIDVIGPAAIERNTGLFELGELLQRLVPSFNFSRTAISDGSDIFRPATLRGLGPDQVLVLINGKRRHNRALLGLAGTVGEGAAGTDFNAIPSASIKSIEVLRDGAAAQYGSDAIAGVINVLLKDSAEGFSVTGLAGEHIEGDGQRIQVQANAGLPLGDKGFINLTGEYREGDPTNRAAKSPEPFAGGKQIFKQGDADTEFFGFFANAAYEVSDKAELYAFGGYSESDALGAGFYRFIDEADRAVPQVFPNGFLPRSRNQANDISFAGGIRGELSDAWTYDVSAVYGENEYEFGAENTINTSIASDFLNNNPGATDAEIAANSGPNSGFSGSQTFQQLTFNVDIAGEVDAGLSNPLYVAFGAEYRDENFELKPGQLESFSCGLSAANAFIPSIIDPATPATCGFQAFPGFRPESAIDADRDSFAFYVDLESNLTDDLLVGVAARFEDYGSVGNELTGKLSARYQVSDTFALRGAVQNGFRAPSLQQLSVEFVTTNVGADGLTETLLARTGSEFPGLLGVDGLDIETSVSFSAGFVWEPLDSVTITVDAYQIAIDDRIVIGNPLTAGDLAAIPAAQDFLNDNLIAQANFFSNSIDTETTGLDIVINHTADFLGGSLNSNLAASFNTTTVDSINPPPGIAPRLVFPAPSESFLETGQPRERLNLAFDWDKDAFGTLLRFNYLSSTKTSFFTEQGLGIPAGAPFNNEAFLKPGSALLVDLELSYRVTENLKFAIGGNNLLDEKPDKVAADSVIAGITRGNLQFPMRGLAYGLNGGFYYARFTASF